MKIGVIVNTYNRPRALNLVLQGLLAQSRRPDEVIIADDGSTSETRDLLTSFVNRGLQLKHVWQPDEGFRRSRILNQAIASSKADLLIFIDGDCIPLPDFIERNSKLYEPGTISAGQRVLLSRGFTDQLESAGNLHVCPSRSSATWFFRFLKGDVNRILPFLALGDSGWRVAQPNRYDLVRGCNFAILRESLILVGGFEEQFEGWGFEDSELAVRLINNGVRVKSLRFSSLVLHLWHPEASRERAGENIAALQRAIADKKRYAAQGLAPAA
jgi:glycosyltransferase involved in cell wall biosynthesis